MTADTVPLQNGVVLQNGDLAAAKKSKDSDRRRRRRKQKKNKVSQQQPSESNAVAGNESDDESAKETADVKKEVVEQVTIEYVPEKAELDDGISDEFRKIFEKFSFRDAAASEEDDKKDESAKDADLKKKADSDSDDEEQDNQQKEKGGLSNKKKKLQRRMKIAELKQICSRPDVVEVWDATAADPKLLVFLKAYRNTVPVPRHWCQKRKFLQDSG